MVGWLCVCPAVCTVLLAGQDLLPVPLLLLLLLLQPLLLLLLFFGYLKGKDENTEFKPHMLCSAGEK